jgi:CBS domain-containing protein
MKTVKEILAAKPKHVWSISPKAKVIDALKLMSEREIGALVVIAEGGAICGIISERDYARKIALLGKQSTLTAVEEIMTPVQDLYQVQPGSTVEECMVLMTANHVRHLPVHEDSAVVGLISIGDVVKAIITEKEYLIEQLNNYISGKSY